MDWTESYKSIIRQKDQNLYANLDWLNTVDVGDYGTWQKGSFERLGNVQTDYGVPVNLNPADSGLTFSNNKGTVSMKQGNVSASGAGAGDEGAGDGSVAVTWTFQDSESLTLVANSVSSIGVDAESFAQAIQSKVPSWPDNQIVVYSVRKLAAGFLIGSEQKNSSYTITGTASGIQDAVEGKATGKFSVATQSWSGIQQLLPSPEMQAGNKPITPATIAFQAVRFSDNGKKYNFF